MGKPSLSTEKVLNEQVPGVIFLVTQRDFYILFMFPQLDVRTCIISMMYP
jgi:hypothetical protein